MGIVRDAQGYLVIGADLLQNGQRPKNWEHDGNRYYMETNIAGMFAGGDVRHDSVQRCASAVGEGAMDVPFVHCYLADGSGLVSSDPRVFPFPNLLRGASAVYHFRLRTKH